MNSLARDLLQDLEDAFVNRPSFSNSVEALGGEIVHLDATLWEASPILRNHPIDADSFKGLDVPETTLVALRDAHRNQTFPEDFSNLLRLLAVTAQLELQELMYKCFDEISLHVKNFTKRNYPSDCSREAVLQFFKILVKNPLRTTDVYKEQLDRIAQHCDDDPDVMMKAMDIVKESVEHFAHLGLDCIPISFGRQCLPIAIIERTGKRQTAILIEDCWTPIELFGKHFDLENVEVETFFYLKYGSYLLYRSDGAVYRKNLQDDSEPKKILEDCTQILTRRNHVFAEVQDQFIFRWTDDDHFVQIFESKELIQSFDFECDERILVVELKSEKTFPVLVFRLENTFPIFLQRFETRHRGSIFLLQKQLVSIHQFLQGNQRTEQRIHLLPHGFIALENPVRSNAYFRKVSTLGGVIYVTDAQGFNIVKDLSSFNNRKLTLTRGECHAYSELWMSA